MEVGGRGRVPLLHRVNGGREALKEVARRHSHPGDDHWRLRGPERVVEMRHLRVRTQLALLFV